METAPKLGPTGERVARNVKQLRGRVPVRELSQRLSKVGRPILPSGVTKIEQGSRRVDADDLFALSIALDVTPNRLLLTESADPDEAMVMLLDGHIGDSTHAATGLRDTRSAWQWACGDGWWGMEFPGEPLPMTISDRRARIQRFSAVNRPHDPADLMPLEEMEPHLEKLQELARIIGELEAEGVSRNAAMNFVRWERLVDSTERQGD